MSKNEGESLGQEILSLSGIAIAQLGWDGPLAHRLHELRQDLQFALFSGDSIETRTRYTAAIHLVAEYLKSVDFPSPIYFELQQLARAMQELDRGTVRDFLKPQAAQNRPTDSSDVWQSRTQIAVAIEQMCADGLSKREACARVAKLFPELKTYLAPKSNNFSATIGDWHERLMKDEVKEPIARDSWNKRAELTAAMEEKLKEAGRDCPRPIDVAFCLVQSALLLADYVHNRTKPRRPTELNLLREQRIEAAFRRLPGSARRVEG